MQRSSNSAESYINNEIADISLRAREATSNGILDESQFLIALDRFQDILIRHHQEINYVNLVTMLHRMASMANEAGCNPGATHERLLQLLIFGIEVHVPELKPRHVGNVIWALGKIRLQMHHTNSSWMAWEPLLYQLVQQGVQRIQEFLPLNISSVLLGLAYLENQNCRPFLPVLVNRAKSMLHAFTPQQICNTIWGLSRLRYIDRQNFLSKIVEQADDMIDAFTTPQMSVTLLSLATFHFLENESIIESIVEIMGTRECHSQPLAIVLWSLLQLFIRPTDAQIGRLLEDCPGFAQPPRSFEQVRDLCMILVALADFDYRSSRRMDLSVRLKRALEAKPIIFTAQDVCNFIWALLIMDSPLLDPNFLDMMFSCLQRIGLETLRDEDIRQFYQGILHVKIFRIRDPEFSLLPTEIEQRWKAVWCVRQVTSPLPLWVAQALVVMERMGYKCQGRFLEQGLINTCTLDLADNFKYAVEGISFVRSFRTPPGRTTGRYLWKVRLLETMGYEVLRIEQGEWMKLVHLDAKKSYLQGKIDVAKANALNKMKAFRLP